MSTPADQARAQLESAPMKFAYSDPPYLGCAAKFYGDATYDSLDTHAQLIERMCAGYPDGWAYSLHSVSLRAILPLCPGDVRIGSWVKPFCAFKVGVNPAYAWEPVIFRGGRTGKQRGRKLDTVRDWHSESITLRKGLIGAKPPGFAMWIANLLGADFRQGDTIDDLFPGTGAMSSVWRAA